MTDTPGPEAMRASSKSEVTAMTVAGLDIENAPALNRLIAPALPDAFPQSTTARRKQAWELSRYRPWFTGGRSVVVIEHLKVASPKAYPKGIEPRINFP
jgi:hypothetical protein